MGVRAGYKKTEVGVIPEDWEVKCFENLKDLKDKWSITGGPFGSNLKSTDYTDDGVRIIQLQNIGDGTFINNYEVYTSQEKANELLSCNIYPNEIILSKMGDPVARACIVPSLHSRYLMCSDGIRLKVDKDKNDVFFIFYYLNAPILRKQAINSSTGSTRMRIGLTELKRLLVAAPLIEEQTAIAKALCDIDDLIIKLEQLIDKKKLIKQGAMQELLNPFDKNGTLKEGWGEKKLSNTATLKARIGWQGLTTAEYKTEGDYLLITGTEFQNGFINWDDCHHVDYDRYKQDRNIQISNEDVLVTKDGTIGKVAFIQDIPKPATLNSGVFVIRPINKIFDPEFFFYVLMSDIFIQFLSQLSAGSTINHLYQKDLIHFTFYVPQAISIQKEIAKTLADMDKDIKILNQKLAKIQKIKQGMMQQLLTGQIRLVNPQGAVNE